VVEVPVDLAFGARGARLDGAFRLFGRELASKQIAQTVNDAIAALPEELRTAITLRELDGLSYEEIAQIMNCPIGTVRSRIFRAREAVAEKLRPQLGTSKDKRW